MTGISVIDQLAVLDEAALARVWCDLNCWEWPADLAAELKPVWWDGTDFTAGRILSDRKTGLNHLVMAHIEAHIGEGAIQAAWAQKTARFLEQRKEGTQNADAEDRA